MVLCLPFTFTVLPACDCVGETRLTRNAWRARSTLRWCVGRATPDTRGRTRHGRVRRIVQYRLQIHLSR